MSIDRLSTSVSFSKSEKDLADKRSKELNFKNRSEYIRSLIFADKKGYNHNDFVIETRELRIQDLENTLEEQKKQKDYDDKYIELVNKDMKELREQRDRAVAAYNKETIKLQSERDRAVKELQDSTKKAECLNNIISVKDDEMVSKIKEQQEAMSSMSESVSTVERLEKELENVKQHRDEVLQLNKSVGSSFESNKAILQQTTEKLHFCEKHLASSKLSCEEWTSKSNNQSVEIEKQSAKIEKLQLKIDELNKGLSDLDHKNDIISSLNEKIADSKNQISKAKKSLEENNILMNKAKNFIGKPKFRNVLQIIRNWIKPQSIINLEDQ